MSKNHNQWTKHHLIPQQYIFVAVTSSPPCVSAALLAQVTDTAMRTMEVACHPTVKWTETEIVSENWTESGTETESGTGTETGEGTETGNVTETETGIEAGRGIETATESGTETEMDLSEVSNHLLSQRGSAKKFKPRKQRCHIILHGV